MTIFFPFLGDFHYASIVDSPSSFLLLALTNEADELGFSPCPNLPNPGYVLPRWARNFPYSLFFSAIGCSSCVRIAHMTRQFPRSIRALFHLSLLRENPLLDPFWNDPLAPDAPVVF